MSGKMGPGGRALIHNLFPAERREFKLLDRSERRAFIQKRIQKMNEQESARLRQLTGRQKFPKARIRACRNTFRRKPGYPIPVFRRSICTALNVQKLNPFSAIRPGTAAAPGRPDFIKAITKISTFLCRKEHHFCPAGR